LFLGVGIVEVGLVEVGLEEIGLEAVVGLEAVAGLGIRGEDMRWERVGLVFLRPWVEGRRRRGSLVVERVEVLDLGGLLMLVFRLQEDGMGRAWAHGP
jgi:hypothetical protein